MIFFSGNVTAFSNSIIADRSYGKTTNKGSSKSHLSTHEIRGDDEGPSTHIAYRVDATESGVVPF